MATEITPVEVNRETFHKLWNVQIFDYRLDGVEMDFETLIVNFSTSRATVIEQEVNPIKTQVEKRNARLSELGTALSNLSKAQQALADEDKGATDSTSIPPETGTVLYSLDSSEFSKGQTQISKQDVEKAIQLVKTEIDKLNNEASSDMTRLQSLVDKRDESFSTASSLMQSISDSRSRVIGNIQ